MDEMRLRLRNILIIICETNWDARLAEGPRDDRSSAYAEESTLYMLEKYSSYTELVDCAHRLSSIIESKEKDLCIFV